jgi:archaellum biogenesis ATPase FlaH
MERIPFGVRQLDTTINGGAPPGSVVLLAGEGGAGSREFMYTSAMMNALIETDPELHDLYYGDLSPGATSPDEVHYLSFTASEKQIAGEVGMTMQDDLLESGFEGIEFHDLSEQYFHVSPVPRDWYADRTPDIEDLRSRHEREGVLGELGSLMSDLASDNLVVIDSLTDLISTAGQDQKLDWSDIAFLVKGLQKGADSWNGLVLVQLNRETISDEKYGQLVDGVTGALEFEWASGGSTRARTLVVKQFRGVLSAIEEEDIIQFETEIGDDGFDISDIRKIR